MRLLLIGLACLLGACAHSPVDDPHDPYESWNRKVYGFNDAVDRAVLKPTAKAYVKVLPSPVRTGIGNFIDNVFYPRVIVNDLLQAKWRHAGRDTTRFLLNSTFGLAGLLDPATMVGLERRNEDFGQTLGYWGLGQGPFLMLPFLGPSTPRELTGFGGDYLVNPLWGVDGSVTVPLAGLRVVNYRAGLLGSEGMIAQQFDPYLFIRGVYLQRRLNLVHDGNPPKEAIDYGE
ncbi:MAG TPA: VacJ family lipoprotein [Solimonas sp.]|nr:VacJ family lipoprotein [Solimonas sp.]